MIRFLNYMECNFVRSCMRIVLIGVHDQAKRVLQRSIWLYGCVTIDNR